MAANGAEGEDPINQFLDNYGKQAAVAEPPAPPVETTAPPIVETPADTPVVPPVVATDLPPQEFNISQLSREQQLSVFSNLTGLEVKSDEQLQAMLDTYGRVPELEKYATLFPKVVDELKKRQNVMDFFPDEETYKVVQLAKDPKYKGKEAVLMQAFKSDLDAMKDLDVISLGASLEKSGKVANPYRNAIKKIGLDPDEVIDNYDELSGDDKDALADAADTYREKLKAIRSTVTAPAVNDDIIKQLEDGEKVAKDDFAGKVSRVMPISNAIVEGITELEIEDGFKFRVEMTPEQKQSYVEFLTQAIVSGEFNLETDEGKRELKDALETEIWVDNRKKIIKAWDTNLRTKMEEEFRQKYNNEKPLNTNEPVVSSSAPRNLLMDVIGNMINERV